MNYQISFQNLPFQPTYKQVFYVENECNYVLNDIIRERHDFLKDIYAKEGLEFVYIPMLLSGEEIAEKVRYYAPYLKSEVLSLPKLKSSMMLEYMAHPENRYRIAPSLLFDAHKEGKEWVLQGITIDDCSVEYLIDILPRIKSLQEIRIDDGPKFSIGGGPRRKLGSLLSDTNEYSGSMVCEDTDTCLYSPIKKRDEDDCPKPRPRPNRSASRPNPTPTDSQTIHFFDAIQSNKKFKENTDVDEDEETEDIETVLDNLRKNIRRLKLSGISLAAIHEFIDKDEHLSRLVITPDNRIFLPDYNNIEIELATLPKALFFLFLRYPEGIVLKYMPDYYKQLLNIYRELKPNANEAKMQVTITQLCNPTKNRINENLTRIAIAFRSKFDDHLAKNYIPLGRPGEPYRIALDPNLVCWED